MRVPAAAAHGQGLEVVPEPGLDVPGVPALHQLAQVVGQVPVPAEGVGPHRTGVRPLIERDEDHLIFNVREPFPSKVTGTEIVCGVVTGRYPLIIQSHMPEDGVIFGDGIERDYLEFTSGRTATIKPSDTRVSLVR